MSRYVDMHCHLDFAADAAAVAREVEAAGSAAFSCTVEAAGYDALCGELSGCARVRVGVGMHPWWVADGRIGPGDIERFSALAATTRYIGEVGLDFGTRHKPGSSAQVEAFRRVVRACSEGGKLVSIHAVRSAGTVMDMLEEEGAIDGNDLVFHWFSGSSQELTRAIRLGFRFSINTMMLGTKRGREYLKAIPADRLLLETDLPEEDARVRSYGHFSAALAETARIVDDVRGPGTAERAAATGATLLGVPWNS